MYYLLICRFAQARVSVPTKSSRPLGSSEPVARDHRRDSCRRGAGSTPAPRCPSSRFVVGTRGSVGRWHARESGGTRVVKNVAGYQLVKLFVGSSGTLAVMMRAFLRLRALPEETRTVARRFRRPLEAEQAWRELRDLPGQPEVAVLLNPAAADAFDLRRRPSRISSSLGIARKRRGRACLCGNRRVVSRCLSRRVFTVEPGFYEPQRQVASHDSARVQDTHRDIRASSRGSQVRSPDGSSPATR